MVQLHEMPVHDLDAWTARIWPLYRDELIRSGISESAADADIQRNLESTYIDGRLAPGNFVFQVLHDNLIVGVVWLNEDDGEWFIYDIEIYEEFRGQGLGRKTMKAIENHVRLHDGKEIRLSVFGFNTAAQNLYKSQGYETVRLAMRKKL